MLGGVFMVHGNHPVVTYVNCSIWVVHLYLQACSGSEHKSQHILSKRQQTITHWAFLLCFLVSHQGKWRQYNQENAVTATVSDTTQLVVKHKR